GSGAPRGGRRHARLRPVRGARGAGGVGRRSGARGGGVSGRALTPWGERVRELARDRAGAIALAGARRAGEVRGGGTGPGRRGRRRRALAYGCRGRARAARPLRRGPEPGAEAPGGTVPGRAGGAARPGGAARGPAAPAATRSLGRARGCRGGVGPREGRPGTG